MPRGRKKKSAVAKVKTRKARAKKSTEVIKCAKCGAEAQKSKYSSNQKYCPKCSKALKLARIKEKNKLKRKAASLKRFAKFIGNETTFKNAEHKLKGYGVSERWRYFRKHHPDYIEAVKRSK